MPKLIIKSAACVFGILCSGGCFSRATSDYVDKLQSSVTNARVISMYYSTGLDAFYTSAMEMKKHSMYVVKIRCFLTCNRYTKNIVDHFKHAKEMSVCPSVEDKYLLIDFGNNKHIEYLKWGNVIVFDGKCFYNKKSIDEVLPSPEAFEKMLDKLKTKMTKH